MLQRRLLARKVDGDFPGRRIVGPRRSIETKEGDGRFTAGVNAHGIVV